MILLDTCAILWWTLEPSMLSESAAAVCRDIPDTGAVISSISIWEIGIKMKKGALRIPETFSGFVNRLQSIDNIEITPVDVKTWVRNIELDWQHQDPADRTIVATAYMRDIPIVTKDSVISGFYPKTIW